MASLSLNVPSVDRLLAKNLVAARCALGWTQEALSAASGISRATIAQLETGYSDPRLSTIEALGKALNITPALLLFGDWEIVGFSRLATEKNPSGEHASAQFLRMLEVQLESSTLKDTARAAEQIRELLQTNATLAPMAVLLGAMFGATKPRPGLAMGVWLGSGFSKGAEAK